MITTVTPIGDELLEKYEKSDRLFDRITFSGSEGQDRIIYRHRRMIDNLPEHLPLVISKEEAESIAKSVGKGKIMNTSFAHTRLRYISNSTWYPIEPKPTNPCWIVYSADREGYNIDVIIINAVEGKILGHGVPFPLSGFSFSGPQDVHRGLG